MEKKELILITGFHHSGTSLLADIVRRLGFDLGPNLDAHNESEELKKIDEEIIGVNWHDLTQIEKGVKSHRNIKLTINHSIQAYKNPRLMVTAPIWNSNFPKSKWLLIQRPFADVAKSIMKKETRPQDPNYWLKVSAYYRYKFYECVAESRLKLLKIDYVKLCKWPDIYVRLIAGFLGVGIKPEVVEWAKESIKLKTYAKDEK